MCFLNVEADNNQFSKVAAKQFRQFIWAKPVVCMQKSMISPGTIRFWSFQLLALASRRFCGHTIWFSNQVDCKAFRLSDLLALRIVSNTSISFNSIRQYRMPCELWTNQRYQPINFELKMVDWIVTVAPQSECRSRSLIHTSNTRVISIPIRFPSHFNCSTLSIFCFFFYAGASMIKYPVDKSTEKKIVRNKFQLSSKQRKNGWWKRETRRRRRRMNDDLLEMIILWENSENYGDKASVTAVTVVWSAPRPKR